MPSSERAYPLVEAVARWSDGLITHQQAGQILVSHAETSLELTTALAGLQTIPRTPRTLRGYWNGGYWNGGRDWNEGDVVVVEHEPYAAVMTCQVRHSGPMSGYWKASTYNECISVVLNFLSTMGRESQEIIATRIHQPQTAQHLVYRHVVSELTLAVNQVEDSRDLQSVLARFQRELTSSGLRAEIGPTISRRRPAARDFSMYGFHETVTDIRVTVAGIVHQFEVDFDVDGRHFNARPVSSQQAVAYYSQGSAFSYGDNNLHRAMNEVLLAFTPPQVISAPAKVQAVLPWEEV